MGLFFDNNELEALLELSVSNVFRIDRKRLDTINSETYHRETSQAHYIKCPVCREFMGRRNFGAKSGVIVDRCSTHGVWLDGGELKRLLEWKKAGGQLLHEMLTQDDKKKRHVTYNDLNISSSDSLADALINKERRHSTSKNTHWEISSTSYGKYDNDDLVSSVFRLIEKLF
jgi:Zn-finger nucleic acid-binding protein